MLTTSFRLLREAGACKPRYRHLARALGGVRAYGADTPIPLAVILRTNGSHDALWVLMGSDGVPPEQEDDRWRTYSAFVDRFAAATREARAKVAWQNFSISTYSQLCDAARAEILADLLGPEPGEP